MGKNKQPFITNLVKVLLPNAVYSIQYGIYNSTENVTYAPCDTVIVHWCIKCIFKGISNGMRSVTVYIQKLLNKSFFILCDRKSILHTVLTQHSMKYHVNM